MCLRFPRTHRWPAEPSLLFLDHKIGRMATNFFYREKTILNDCKPINFFERTPFPIGRERDILYCSPDKVPSRALKALSLFEVCSFSEKWFCCTYHNIILQPSFHSLFEAFGPLRLTSPVLGFTFS